MILHIPFAMSSILSWAIDLLFSFLRLLSFFFRCVCFVETVKNSLSMTPRQNRDQKRSDVTVDSHLKKLSICGFHRPCCRNTFNFSRIDLSLTFTQPLPSVSDIWVNVSTLYSVRYSTNHRLLCITYNCWHQYRASVRFRWQISFLNNCESLFFIWFDDGFHWSY